jgi:Kef-type K+ transport system membrane component KefB/nucleotide-binding universal stress UspA family protein
MASFNLPLLGGGLFQEDILLGILKPLGHHELLLVLVQLAILLFASRVLGELMRRLNQPPVIGELLAGVVLGPSLFGWFFPAAYTTIFPASQLQADLLSAISWLGVLFLLVVTGLETDLNLILHKGKTALMVSMGGIVIPFISGFGLGQVLPDSFLANPSGRLVFSLFIATAMSISAIPVIAKVLMDLNLIRRDIGQLTLAAGMTDDTIGWILLSVVAGLASGGAFNPGKLLSTILAALIFLGFSFTIGRAAIAFILRWVDDQIGGAAASLSTVLILALGAAAFTHYLGLEAVLGAFVIGILAGQSPRFNRQAGLTLELLTAGFLAPIFFAAAGLKVNLTLLLDPHIFGIGMGVLLIACVGKFSGAYLGARLGGLSHWEGLSLGAGMNARGAMEIIVATIGLSLGVLNLDMYSIILMVAIVTSMMAPPLLRWTLSNVVMGTEESQRLEAEARHSQSFLKRIRRVLLPTRGGTNMQLAAQLISHLAYQTPLEVTAVYALDTLPPARSGRVISHDPGAASAFNSLLQGIRLPAGQPLNPPFQTKLLTGKNKAAAILQEAQKGYDLILLGATEVRPVSGALFSAIVDQIVQESPCPTLVVKAYPEAQTDPPHEYTFNHLLVPTSGTEYSTYAVEIASAIAAQTGGVVTLLNVIHQSATDYLIYEENTIAAMREMAEQVVQQQAILGRGFGARVEASIRIGNPEQEILRYAAEENVDLILLGSNVRHVTGRVFLGHRVDAILLKSTCPVVVISAKV